MSAARRSRVEKPVSDAIKRAAARAGIVPRPAVDLLAEGLRAMHADLGQVIEHVIGSRITGEFDHENFEEALVKLRGVRICLYHEVQKLGTSAAVTP